MTAEIRSATGAATGAEPDHRHLRLPPQHYESEVIRRHARDAGRRDLVVVNTCAVTAEAERQARQAIRRLRREASRRLRSSSPAAPPRSQPERLERPFGGNRPRPPRQRREDARRGLAIPRRTRSGFRVADIMGVERRPPRHLIEGFEGRARAFLQVQNGCDHRCTFCIIPYGRGPSRSVPIGEIVTQARALVAGRLSGAWLLTGVDVTSLWPRPAGPADAGPDDPPPAGPWCRSCRAQGSPRSIRWRSTTTCGA